MRDSLESTGTALLDLPVHDLGWNRRASDRDEFDETVPHRRFLCRFVVVVLVCLAVGTFAVLRPAGLGGTYTYVTPANAPHDLAAVVPAADYRVGDVVAYRTEVGGPVAVLPVVAVQGDRLATRSATFRATDVIGRQRMRVPAGTTVLHALRNMGIAAASLVAGYAVFTAGFRRRRVVSFGRTAGAVR